MVTLLRVNAEGHGGRCDAKCHDAHTPDCHCVCGGENHGVGQAQAVANTRAGVDDLVARYASTRGVDPAALDVAIAPEVSQGTLFS